ncbi:MAG TPA: hypothetical protein VH762_02100, partial [Gemmatimonadaceae bacterium]
MFRVEPVTLEGKLVRLVPLTFQHVNALCDVGLDASLWTWTPVQISDCDGMRAFVEEALAEQRAGNALAFATTLRESGQVIGATRFMSIVPAHRRV